MRRVLIVEDNLKAASVIHKLLKETRGDLIIDEATSLEEAKELLLHAEYHLFIVDIILDAYNPNDAGGLEFIQFVRGFKKYDYTPVVVTTSVAEMKDHAYDNLYCSAYLEKPYDMARARRVLERVLNTPTEHMNKKYMYIKCNGIVKALKCKDVVCVTYSDKTVCIKSVNECTTLYYKSLSEVNEILTDKDFFRCSNNTIVNRRYIDYIDSPNNKIHLRDNYGTVKIGMKYKKRVRASVKYDF